MSVALLPATEQLHLLKNKHISPSELAEEHIRRIERLNPALNAIPTASVGNSQNSPPVNSNLFRSLSNLRSPLPGTAARSAARCMPDTSLPKTPLLCRDLDKPEP